MITVDFDGFHAEMNSTRYSISQDLFALLWHKAHLFHDLVFDSSQIFATTKTVPSLLDTYQIEISIYMRAIPVEHPSIVLKHNFRPFAWNRLCLWFNMKIFLFMPRRNNTNNSTESFDENILIKITWTTSFYVVYNSPETNQREHQVECESTFFLLSISVSISFWNGYCWNLHLWAALRQSIFSAATEGELQSTKKKFQHFNTQR